MVKDFEPETLRSALERMLAMTPDDRRRIRGNSGEYRLEAGIERYASIYRKLAPSGPGGELQATPASVPAKAAASC